MTVFLRSPLAHRLRSPVAGHPVLLHSRFELLIPLAIPVILRCQLDRAGIGAAGGGEVIARFFGLSTPELKIGGIRSDTRYSVQIHGGAVEVSLL